MEDDTPIEVRIMRVHGELSPGERKLAAVLLEMNGNFSGFTAGELAARADVSNPTAARFFRRLGYANYQQAHNQARDRASAGSPLTALRKKSRRDSASFDFAPYAEHEAQNLRRTAMDIAPADLAEAVRLLKTSRRIWIVGYRNSTVVAIYLHAVLSLLRDGASLAPRAGMTLSEELVNMGKDDLVVLLAFRRRPAILSRILREARKQGARALQITDPGQPLSPDASVLTLRCSVEGLGIFDNYGCAITLVNCLASLLEESIGSAAVQRLSEVERLLDEVDGVATGT
ncbi:MurR/RpiR family transcriptional regulator [Gluconacetobacter asukensis]|uniref:MurR/RpiR family transcriptional regulator n=1 Tax=Gluconacetobacter asukensis TaxID=1017181 RepID=A0A7W4J0J6_9PROT|nr:MurR/RpiR family transcriptional regulator [Gluconacetobacter asukensis]MBB2172414.1 MurR/RpiR family transcriptional regulator [Gluconacetobacter asukensis]